MSSLANPLSLLKLVQCFHCHQLADHTKDQCPHIASPQPCSKCGELGHSFSDCSNQASCTSCSGNHPITARCCPAYKAKMDEHVMLVFHQLHSSSSFMAEYSQWQQQNHPNYSFNTSYTSASPSLSEVTWAAAQDAATQAENSMDFMNSLYTLLKSSRPTLTPDSPPCSPHTSYELPMTTQLPDETSKAESSAPHEQFKTPPSNIKNRHQ